MYRKSFNWRRQKGVERIQDWEAPLVLRKFYPGGFCGFDKEGSPVWIIPFGKADMKGMKDFHHKKSTSISGMLACASVEEFMDFTLKIVECSLHLMRQKSAETSKPVTQHVFIFDLDGFSLKVPST